MGWPGPEGSLRDLINRKAKELERQLAAVQRAIEAMSEKPIRSQDFESLKLQVIGLAEGLYELEQRVEQLEQHKSLASWLFRQIVTFAVLLALIYALGVWE